MLAEIVRRRLAALRTPARTARVAFALWIAWAVIVWNLVLDHVIVVSGRQYIHNALVAVDTGAPYARMDDVMRPALARAFWTANAAAAVILVVGLAGIALASRRTGTP